ncbi:tetratricopeptide repeat protein [bacterium]|nr:tetratricopeptide repeat protein [bacterium]
MISKRIFLLLICFSIFAFAQDKILQEGEVYFQSKQYQKAIDAFQKVASREGWNEDIAKANLRLGQCYLALEDVGNARKYFQMATKDKGDIGSQAKLGIALCDIQEEKYDSAIDSLTSLIEAKPERMTLAYAYYNRGVAYERKGWLAKAIEDYQEAVTLGTGDDSLLSSAKARLLTCQSQYEQFQQEEQNYLQKIQSATRPDAIRDLYHELARKCAQVGEIDKGIEYELKSLDYSDDYNYNAGAWMNIAWRYVMKKDYEKAGDAFKKVAQEYPQSEYAPEALLRAGDMYAQSKKPDDAIAVYQEFVDKYPKDPRVPSALMNIAWRYSDKKDFVKSAETFKKVADEYPNSESAKEALLRAGDMYAKAGKNEEAIKIYQEFAQKYPNDENASKALLDIAWRYRAIYLETGDENAKKQKETILQEIANRFPDTEMAYFALGLLYEDNGQYDKAIENYKKCAAKNGTQKDVALFGVATCYYDITMIKEAHEYYDKLVKECPDSPLLPNAIFNRGATSSDLGDYRGALEDYKEVKEKYPESYYAPISSAFIATTYEHLYDYQSALKEYLEFTDVLKKAEALPAHLRHLASMRGVVLLRVGACYLNLGQFDKAEEVWRNIKKECPDLKWVGMIGDRVADSLEKIKKAYGGQLPQIAPRKYSPPEKTRTPISGIITPRNVGLTMGLEGRHIFVYGTQGSQEEKEAGLEVAQTLQKMEIKSTRFKIDIKADTDVTEKDIQNRPLILIGTPGSNKIIEEIKDKLPIKLEKDQIVVGNRTYKGKDVGVFMVAPNPKNLSQYIVVIFGLTPEALKNAVNIHHDSDPNPLLIQTDYLVYDAKSGGPEKPVLEEGFFIKESMDNWHPL